MRLSRTGLWCAAITLLLMQQPLNAVCVSLTFSELLANPDVTLIFHGTVREVQRSPAGEIVTFDVLRVWKGQVPRRITVYNHRYGVEWLPFKRGASYLVEAYQLAPEQRAAFGLRDSEPLAYGAGFCSAQEADAAGALALADGYRGREP
jgi:hypothetical protein